MIDQIAEPALAAAGYSLLWYGRRRTQTGETFDASKFAATVLVGIAAGIGMAWAGIDVSQGTIETRLVAYAGAVSVIEALLKSIKDAYKSRVGREAKTGGSGR